MFAGVQAVHPPESLTAVSTDLWAWVHYAGVVFCMLNALGVAAIYARQAERAGHMGLAGFLLLELMWVPSVAFQFVEGLVLPRLVTESPAFVEGFLSLSSGSGAGMPIPVLNGVYMATSIAYLAGGLLLGVATFRAAVLPRAAGLLLAVGTVTPLVLSMLLPHEYIRLAALPVAFALMWLGGALALERRSAVEADLATNTPAQGPRAAVAG
jgi:hypothetical protein